MKLRINHIIHVSLALILSTCLISCSEDETYSVPEAGDGGRVVECSVEEGSTIDSKTTEILLTYSADMALNQAVHPTINGKDASIEFLTDDEDNIIRNSLRVPVSLKAGEDYELIIPKRQLTAVNSAAFAEEFTLHFTAAVPALGKIDALTNAKATPEAKNVYSMLVNNYGKKMLSGAMGEVAWGLKYTDYINSQAGAYPAIVGFDYIHLEFSPSNWIDYGNITPVRTAWEAGSIPAISWHWRVPKSQGSKDREFRTDGNNFSCAKATEAGTWENEVINADIARIAEYLKLLQDAGIPVIFRPLHEAAGDYTWGPWFWWGNSGVEATKKLWVYLHDKLTNDYGLNNLIWAWTMQLSSEGKPAPAEKIAEAYPGNAYVDIVGTDLYPSTTLTDQSESFELINKICGGHKLIALTECGNLIDPDTAAKRNALWSYFMQWYDIDNDGNPVFNAYFGPEQWQTVVSSKYVLNRGGFSVK